MTDDASLYLVTYDPLVATRAGREASAAHALPPFIDGSIRREPDLQHKLPSISCLCRADKFTPRLRVGDVVVYMAKKRRYGSLPPHAHRRLTAILRVVHLFDGHEEAAAAYRSAGLPLPSNCMVSDNPPNPVSHSHRINSYSNLPDDEEFQRRWDALYRARARSFTRVVASEPLFVDLGWNAPVVQDEDLKAVFGYVPGTLNPRQLDIKYLPKLAQQLGLRVRPFGQRSARSVALSRRNTAGRAPSGTPADPSARPRSACSPSRRTGRGRARPQGC